MGYFYHYVVLVLNIQVLKQQLVDLAMDIVCLLDEWLEFAIRYVKSWEPSIVAFQKIVTFTSFGAHSVVLNVDSDVDSHLCQFWPMSIAFSII